MRHNLRAKLEQAKPVVDAVMSSRRSKHLPYLADYLEQQAHQPMGVGVSVLLGCLGTFAGVVLLQAALQVFMLWYWALAVNVLVGGPVVTAVVSWGIHLLRKPKTPRDRRLADVRKAGDSMRQMLPRKQLARSLGRPLSELIEESARNWNRAQVALNGPFWTGEGLPGHWSAIRDQALAACDDAMQDLVLLAAQNLRPPSHQRTDWQQVVGDVVGGLLGMPPAEDNEPLPPMFGQARAIADKLKLLATEVEQATQQVIADQPQSDAVPSATSLDRCLTDLRQVQEAESELRQNLGGF